MLSTTDKSLSHIGVFLQKIIAFSAPILIVFLIVEFFLSGVDNSYSLKLKQWEQHQDTVEVVNIGSSHGYMAFDPESYSYNGYNFANVSQSLYYDMKITEYIFQNSKSIKVIIIPISYFSLGYKLTDEDDYWRSFFYERVFGFPYEDNSHAFEIKRFSLFALYGSNESLKLMMNGFKGNLVDHISEKGAYMEKEYDLSAMRKSISAENGITRVEYHDKLNLTNNYDQNSSYLKKIIQICKEHNASPVIVTTPVYSTYSSAMDKRNWRETVTRLESIGKSYDVQYFDYLTDERFTAEDFRDNDHLNPAGARKFSKIVDSEILKVLMKTHQ